jgi:hypothetical protein
MRLLHIVQIQFLALGRHREGVISITIVSSWSGQEDQPCAAA